MGHSGGRTVESKVSAPEAEWLLEMAGLPELESMSPLEGGWDNTNILLRLIDGRDVVLKAWFANSVEEVERVLQRHVHLDSHGIPTTVPFPLSDGRLFAERRGVAWTILPFVSGGMLEYDDSSLFNLGAILARMGSLPFSDCFPKEYRMGFGLFDEVMQSFSPGGDVSFFEILSSETSRLKSELSETLPMGILHGDLFPDNIIGSNGKVLAILDFEEGWIGPKVFDLVMSFVGFGWHEGKPVGRRWRALVKGYESVRCLSSEEISSLPTMHRFATLSIACWRYWKHNISVPDDNLSKRYLEMVDRLGTEIDFTEGFG